jgi:DNA-directed RNA polymerase specialized sigma24 family protein
MWTLGHVFNSLTQNISHFKKRSSISTWLDRIVVNTTLMKLRSEKLENAYAKGG